MESGREGESEREQVGSPFAPASLTGGKGTVVERDWKVDCKKRRKGKKREENGRTGLEGRKRGDQVVTVKSCFSLGSSGLDRRYNREDVGGDAD